MRNQKGFPLIELMIVIVLVALLSGLTLWNMRTFSGMVVRADIEKLYTTCIYLRQKAVSTHTEQLLEFDHANNTYRYDDTIEHLSTTTIYGFVKGVMGPPSSLQAPISTYNTFDHNRIIFYPDGIIQSGTLYITDKDKKALYALTSGVGQVSFLRKYRYDGSWHLL
jgi:prepilin-type N-terminal cleavage/methylation domain-containing protein